MEGLKVKSRYVPPTLFPGGELVPSGTQQQGQQGGNGGLKRRAATIQVWLEQAVVTRVRDIVRFPVGRTQTGQDRAVRQCFLFSAGWHRQAHTKELPQDQ